MSVDHVASFSAESQRQEAIAERQMESGPDWDKGFEPGTLGGHELLDRTYLILNLIEQHLLDHPSCLRDPSWFATAERAAAALRELYQDVGAAQPENASTDVVPQQ